MACCVAAWPLTGMQLSFWQGCQPGAVTITCKPLSASEAWWSPTRAAACVVLLPTVVVDTSALAESDHNWHSAVSSCAAV